MLEELPGALISVSGTSVDDIWFVGGDPGDATGALVVHYDGETFSRVDSGVHEDLWWVHACAADQAFMGGTNGTILSARSGKFSAMTTPGTGTVFGIWGTACNELWAVGGDPSRESSAFVWQLLDGRWEEVAEVPAPAVSSYFKIWGRAADDFRIVGADGVIVHVDETGYSLVDAGVTSNLTTVHAATGTGYTAVGGFGDGLILEDAGQGWQDRTPEPAPKRLFGVWQSKTMAYAVGANGTILGRTPGGWREEVVEPIVTFDLHATWIDPAGGAWAVGGDLVSTPMTDGLVLYKGAALPAAEWGP